MYKQMSRIPTIRLRFAGPASKARSPHSRAADPEIEAAGARVDFGASSKLSVRVLRSGREKLPIVVMDEVLRNPEQVIDFVRDQIPFVTEEERRSNYPGVRSPTPRGYKEMLRTLVSPIAASIFKLPQDVGLEPDCMFSLTTTGRADLRPLQRLPHYDLAGFGMLATVHYLFRSSFGGTAFYRHRSTGTEAVSADGEKAYRQALADELADATLAPEYVAGSGQFFEQVGEVPAAFNRLILFPGNMLHSASILPNHQLTSSVDHGRLTVTSFIRLD